MALEKEDTMMDDFIDVDVVLVSRLELLEGKLFEVVEEVIVLSQNLIVDELYNLIGFHHI